MANVSRVHRASCLSLHVKGFVQLAEVIYVLLHSRLHATLIHDHDGKDLWAVRHHVIDRKFSHANVACQIVGVKGLFNNLTR